MQLCLFVLVEAEQGVDVSEVLADDVLCQRLAVHRYFEAGSVAVPGDLPGVLAVEDHPVLFLVVVGAAFLGDGLDHEAPVVRLDLGEPEREVGRVAGALGGVHQLLADLRVGDVDEAALFGLFELVLDDFAVLCASWPALVHLLAALGRHAVLAFVVVSVAVVVAHHHLLFEIISASSALYSVPVNYFAN